MALVDLKTILADANKQSYAVGAFNINNLEFLQAIIEAAETEQSPVIISTSEGAINYAGMDELGALVHLAAKRADVPIAFHLDHGKNIDLVKKAITSGLYTSVMYDGSSLSLLKNIEQTKEIVALANKHNVSVEAELGAIAGIEDFVSVQEQDAHLTNPEEAERFVNETGCDALAIAIGTSHGAYKYSGESQLDIERLKQIHQRVDIPLVLHGASGIPSPIKQQCLDYGCKIADAKGVDDEDVRKAIAHGIHKVNIDTDLRIAFDAGIRKYLQEHPDVIDPRKILTSAKELITQVVQKKMQLFGSSNKA